MMVDIIVAKQGNLLKMSKILLVRPISEKATNIMPLLGLGYLAGALKEHEVEYLDCVKEKMGFDKFFSILTC